MAPSLTSVFHTPHSILQQILSFLLSKPIKNLTTSFYFHHNRLCPNPHYLFSGLFYQPSWPLPPPVYSQVGQRILMKIKSDHDIHLPKTFQWIPFSLTAKSSPPCGLWGLTWSLWLIPCYFPSAHHIHVKFHEHMSHTFYFRAFAFAVLTTRNALPPDISKAHSLTSFRPSLK